MRHLFVTALSLALALPALAGPLTPPGAPAPTHKTLTEVEPRTIINATNTPGDADSIYRITESGSYYLTENLDGVSGKRGIEVYANRVTIDLNGFTLLGVSGSLEGIRNYGTHDLTVHNGTVRGWGLDGIDSDFNIPGCKVYDVFAISNGGKGISLSNYGIIDRCVASHNGSDGFRVSAFGTISNSVADSNGADGVNATNECIVSNTYSSRNASEGFKLGVGTVVENCAAYANDGDGYYSNSGGIIRSSVAWANEGDGFQMNQGSILQCVSSKNLQHGYNVFGRSIIRENNAYDNGVTGFHIAGPYNRVEHNTSTENETGYNLQGENNVLIGNLASASLGNNYSVASNNWWGTVVDWTSSVSIGFSGNGAPSALGTTDPHANYSQ